MRAPDLVRRSFLSACLAVLAAIVLAGPASADGARVLELTSVGGLPVAGSSHDFTVRLVEGGDHAVDGARVIFIAGIGGDHGEHSLHDGGSGEYAPPFEVEATPGGTPGEYVVSAAFPRDGMWTVWVVAEEGGVRTESSWTVSVVPASSVSTDTSDPSGGSTGGGTDEATAGSSTPGTSIPVDTAGGAGIAPLSQPGGEGGERGHDDGHADLGGSVNWWVIGGFATTVTGAWLHAAWLKRRLRNRMASGALVDAGMLP